MQGLSTSTEWHLSKSMEYLAPVGSRGCTEPKRHKGRRVHLGLYSKPCCTCLPTALISALVHMLQQGNRAKRAMSLADICFFRRPWPLSQSQQQADARSRVAKLIVLKFEQPGLLLLQGARAGTPSLTS